MLKNNQRSSTSPPGGNQVDGLPPALSLESAAHSSYHCLLEVGSCRLEARSQRPKAGGQKPEAGSGKPEARGEELEAIAGSRTRSEKGKKSFKPSRKIVKVQN